MLKAAVIVPAYNSRDKITRPCIESVLHASTNVVFRLVVVDNGSMDETPSYLSAISARQSNVTVRLNPANLGYAAGNNASRCYMQLYRRQDWTPFA